MNKYNCSKLLELLVIVTSNLLGLQRSDRLADKFMVHVASHGYCPSSPSPPRWGVLGYSSAAGWWLHMLLIRFHCF